LVGAVFLGCILRGEAINWNTPDVLPGKVNCVLAVFRLLHVQVRFVIPEELGGEYE
jgi:hypothetical protein